MGISYAMLKSGILKIRCMERLLHNKKKMGTTNCKTFYCFSYSRILDKYIRFFYVKIFCSSFFWFFFVFGLVARMTNDEYFTYDGWYFVETGRSSEGNFLQLLLGERPFQGQGFLSHEGTVALEKIPVSGCRRGWREEWRDRGEGVGRLIVVRGVISEVGGCCLCRLVLRWAGWWSPTSQKSLIKVKIEIKFM